MKTSIILTCKIRNKTQAHMTMACIGNILRYTNPEEYELIVVNPEPSEAIRDDFKNFKIDKQLLPSPDPGYTACMNLGAKEATGEYLVFIQNDVFVHEGWLKNLRYYLENDITDCIIPDQMPRDRAFVLESYKLDPIEAMKWGSRDEGLWMMTKVGYDKFGGFAEDLSLLHARDFYQRWAQAGLRLNDTCKTMITHIMGATNWQQYNDDYEKYNERMNKDAKKLNG